MKVLFLKVTGERTVHYVDILASSGSNKYIIEVKKSVSDLTPKQIDKLTNPLNEKYFNHEGREIIYYIENPIPSGPEQLKNLRLLEEKGIRVISSPEELRGLFQL